MRWSDENYVKWYTRDTPTWLSLGWQARALLGLLVRKLDKAGLLECGELGRSAVFLVTGVPGDVFEVGLVELERVGTIEWHGTTLMAPNFEEAQEARKTDAQKKRDQRSRDKDKARARALEFKEQAVTRSHRVSPPVTESHQASPSSPASSPTSASSPSPFSPPRKKAARAVAEEPPDPTWQPLVDACFAVFRRYRGTDPAPSGRDWVALKRLRKRATDAEIPIRFGRGLQGQFKERVDGFADLEAKWDALTGTAATGPPKKDLSRGMVRAQDVDQTEFERMGVGNVGGL